MTAHSEGSRASSSLAFFFRRPAWVGSGLALALLLAGLALCAVGGLPPKMMPEPAARPGGLSTDRGPMESERPVRAHREVRHQGGFRYVNPLLECHSDESRYRLLRPFRQKLEAHIHEAVQRKAAIHVSVYFRDLNNGPWMGINERERFEPASLMKVPLMMAYFAMNEEDRGVFSRQVKLDFPESFNLEGNIRPREQMVRGRSYTIDELIRRMIVYSDNDASELLLQRADAETLASVYLDLGLSDPRTITEWDFMTVKEYASFFRILFNASYLSKADSERALRILAQCDFKDGLVAGVPPDTVVAHKYGERSLADQRLPVRQLHDCGIVYYPQHPYLLCVMTRGTDFTALSGVVRDVSRLVYEEVETQFESRR